MGEIVFSSGNGEINIGTIRVDREFRRDGEGRLTLVCEDYEAIVAATRARFLGILRGVLRPGISMALDPDSLDGYLLNQANIARIDGRDLPRPLPYNAPDRPSLLGFARACPEARPPDAGVPVTARPASEERMCRNPPAVTHQGLLQTIHGGRCAPCHSRSRPSSPAHCTHCHGREERQSHERTLLSLTEPRHHTGENYLNSQCTCCHTGPLRGIPSPEETARRAAALPIPQHLVCTTCHASSFHLPEATASPDTRDGCPSCHDMSQLPAREVARFGLAGTARSAPHHASAPDFNRCPSCHDRETGALPVRLPPRGTTVMDAHQTCAVCHPAEVPHSPSESPVSNPSGVQNRGCVRCHSDPADILAREAVRFPGIPPSLLHHDNTHCPTCHTPERGSLAARLLSADASVARPHDRCAPCHGEEAPHSTSLAAAQITPVVGCRRCHDIPQIPVQEGVRLALEGPRHHRWTVASAAHLTFDGCLRCHNSQNGDFLSRLMPPDAQATSHQRCGVEGCHTNAVPSATTFGSVRYDTTCRTCHPSLAGLQSPGTVHFSGHMNAARAINPANGCPTCHTGPNILSQCMSACHGEEARYARRFPEVPRPSGDSFHYRDPALTRLRSAVLRPGEPRLCFSCHFPLQNFNRRGDSPGRDSGR